MPPSVAKSCILIVEDNEDMLHLLNLVLSGEGYYVALARDGAYAISLLQEFRPALILTDLNMPNVSGIELIRFIRNSKAHQSIPIIAISAQGSKTLEEARGEGATEVLLKPIEFTELAELASSYVPDRAPIIEP